MSSQSLLERSKKLLEKLQRRQNTVSHRSYARFPEEVRTAVAKSRNVIKKAILTSALGVATFSPVSVNMPTSAAASHNAQTSIMVEQQGVIIQRLVNDKAANIQKQFMANIDCMQQQIINAKKTGRRNQYIKGILNEVYSKGGFTGAENYCCAVPAYILKNLQDEVLGGLLADPGKLPRDYKKVDGSSLDSHPNVSCPSMRAYFKNTFSNQCYAEKGDANFKEVVNKLEAGDIITIKSATNTSSGEHCLVCAGPVEDGKLPVKSFNLERNYNVPVTRIVGAVKLMEQYRMEYAKELVQKSQSRYAHLSGNDTFNLSAIQEELAKQNQVTSNNPLQLRLTNSRMERL